MKKRVLPRLLLGLLLLSCPNGSVFAANPAVGVKGIVAGSQAQGSSSNSSASNPGGYNVANDNPALYSGLNNSVPEGLTQEPQTLWKRDTLLGDLGGFRTQMENHGIAITPVYIGEVMGNVSGGAGGYKGTGEGVIYEHLLNLPVDITLSRIVPGWDDAIIHANALWIAGPGLSPSYVGDISNTSNIQGFNTVRLQELWYEQGFWNKRISLKVGNIAADSEFFTSDTASLFINGTFGAFTFVGANLPDPYDPNVYPMASPGVRFMIQPTSNFYFMAGLFDGTSQSQTDNPNGVNFHLNGSDGMLIFSEVGYLLNQGPFDRGLAGTYKIGSFVHTHNFNSWSSQASGNLESNGTDYGIYGVLDQTLYDKAGQSISFFTRAGHAPSNTNTIDWYVDGGFNFTGFIPGRILDVAGLAVARSSFSHAFSDYSVETDGGNPHSAETVLEATYKAQITRWWTIQPDLQYIWTPSGEEGVKDSLVLGLRTSVTF